MTRAQITDAMKVLGDPEMARQQQRFFRTGEGEDGERDRFFK